MLNGMSPTSRIEIENDVGAFILCTLRTQKYSKETYLTNMRIPVGSKAL